MKRIIVLFLAAIMVLSVFACTKNNEEKPATSTTEGSEPPVTTPTVTTPTVTTPDVTTTNDPNAPNVPENINFNGAKFRIAAREMFLKEEVFAPETSTNPCDIAINERNAVVQDTYGIVIEPFVSYSTTVGGHADELVTLMLSEEDKYDISLTYAISSDFVVQGLAYNWNNLPYTDFSKEYWISEVNERLSIDGAIYNPVGEMCTTALTWTYAVFYNRTKGDQMYLEDDSSITETVFEKIDNGEWTIDYFISLVGEIYSDIDDTTGLSKDDFYGFAAWTGNDVDMYPYALNIPIILPDDEDVLKFALGTEKASIAVDKINELYWNTNGSYCTGHDADTVQVHPIKFAKGEALFTTAHLRQCFEIFADMEDQYTILPYPMYDETQDKYRTSAADRYSVLTIPITATNFELISVITEALNYESMKRVVPAYYEETLQKKFTRDPESIEMLDLIMDGRTFDISTILFHEISWEFRHAITGRNKDFKTYCDRRQELFASKIKKVVDKYKENQ